MYKIFITKLVSELNIDMDTINTMIKLGVVVYQLIFLLLDCNCGLVCSEYSLKNVFLIYPAHLELHSRSCQVELILSEPCSPIKPDPVFHLLIQCTVWSSKMCILGRLVASGKFVL